MQARQEEAANMRSRLERAEKAIEQERAVSMKLRNQLEESQNQVPLSPCPPLPFFLPHFPAVQIP